jgi:hypothetical protein
MRILAVLVFGIATAMLASAQAFAQHPEGEPSEIVKRAITNLKNGEDIFVADNAGKARHVQSGLTCAGYVQNAFLNQVMVFETPAGIGADVGCDYARRKSPGSSQAAAKHTVFVVKLPEGWTLEKAFANYQAEMHQTAPKDARSGGDSLTFGVPIDGFPKFLSEELFYTKDGREWQTELIVAVLNGWIIEVRSTKISQFALAAQEEAADQPAGAALFFAAVADLGGPRFEPSFEVKWADSDKAETPR